MNQNRHNQPDDEAEPDRISRQRRQLNREQVVLVDKIIGSWFAGLALVAGLVGLYAHHESSAVALGIAALIALVAGVALHVRHINRRKRTIAWKLFAPLAFAHVVCLIMALALFVYAPEPSAFRISHNIPIWGRTIKTKISRTELTAFAVSRGNMWAVTNGPNPVAVPVDLLMYVAITNVSKMPRAITEYDAAVGSTAEGPWEKLCHIDLRTSTAYWITPDPSRAGSIATTKILDDELGETPIGIGGVIGGWAAWSCPKKSTDECKPDFFRLTLYDSLGEAREYVVPNTQEAAAKQHEDLMKSEMQMGAEIADLSHTPRRDECDPQ
ncbi:MAG: hypothetical protein ABSA49_05260 [Rhizomicrobium sp.]